MNMVFNIWLERELEKRGWNHSDLAREAKKSSGAISHLFNGLSNPTLGICNDIADALGLPRKILYERAGLVQPEPESDNITEELLYTARLLPETERIDLLDTARAKLRRYAKNNPRITEDSGGTEFI